MKTSQNLLPPRAFLAWAEAQPIGQVMRSFRKSLGLKQSQLAQKLCVRPNTIWRYETGLIQPSSPVLILLLQLFLREGVSQEGTSVSEGFYTLLGVLQKQGVSLADVVLPQGHLKSLGAFVPTDIVSAVEPPRAMSEVSNFPDIPQQVHGSEGTSEVVKP